MNKLVLCIIDGFGIAPKSKANPIYDTMPFWQSLLKQYPNYSLRADGPSVGLPEGQFGNSETGHMTIGMGQVVKQDLTILNDALKKIDENEVLKRIVKNIRGSVHLIGLYSQGGVHSYKNHFDIFMDFFRRNNVHFYTHIFTDGRDTQPEVILEDLTFTPTTISGRYYGMDRDKRWERTDQAFNAILKGDGLKFDNIREYINDQYHKGISDEFIQSAVWESYKGIKEGDVCIILNFRPDRILQIAQRFLEHKIKVYTISSVPKLDIQAIFERKKLQDGLGEKISKMGLRQLRVAETEKYAHVTYFFNGGVQEPFEKEDHILIPSSKVATYDLDPEMKAREITQAVIQGMRDQYDVIILNYANPDMVGHTGNLEATKKALSCIDDELKKLVDACLFNKYTLVITADHGNCEHMLEPDGTIDKKHTSNPVPLVVVGCKRHFICKGLSDIESICLNIIQDKYL